MGMMDKFKNLIGVPEDEFEPMDDELDFVPSTSNFSSGNISGYGTIPPLSSEPLDMSAPKRANKVVNIAATTQLQVVLVKPERFEDASFIADHLNDKKTVVLNLESTSKEVSRRLLDFLSGVAYANEGQVKRVANSTYIITPYNVDFVGDLLDELENNGIYF